MRWDRPKYSAALGYSFYRAIDNGIASVEGDDARFLAAPTHKVTVSGTWHVNQSLDCNFSGYWLSERLAYAYPAAGVTGLPADFVLNAFVNYQFKRFATGIGVANLLDEKLYAPQPYSGVSGPMPLMGRQIFVRLAFKF